jgi:hypothetical protein
MTLIFSWLYIDQALRQWKNVSEIYWSFYQNALSVAFISCMWQNLSTWLVFKFSLYVCTQILLPYVGKSDSMFTLLSWNEEKNIFDLKSVNMILISLLKLRRKYIIIRCSVYFQAGSQIFLHLQPDGRQQKIILTCTFKIQITSSLV